MARAKAGPVVTDNGNFIIDAPFSEAALRNPREVPSISSTLRSLLTCGQLLVSIKLLTGVVEVGIFCDVVKAAYFGNQVSTWAITSLASVDREYRTEVYQLDL
jgi:ribose 5-phosphate isomerase A